MLLHGDVRASRFSDEAIRDPRTVAARARVTVEPDEADRLARPRAPLHRARDGRDGRGSHDRGSRDDRPAARRGPLAPQSLVDKFTGLVTPPVGEVRGPRRLQRWVDGLDAVDDVSELAGALAGPRVALRSPHATLQLGR